MSQSMLLNVILPKVIIEMTPTKHPKKTDNATSPLKFLCSLRKEGVQVSNKKTGGENGTKMS